MAYRRGATFVRNALERSTPLDRNQRARILFIAEALDRATKAKGRRNGALGYVGVAVLRCLLLAFHNSRTGLCCPSYEAIQRATGLCRQSIARALQRLAAVGIVGIARRLDRVVVGGLVRCQQATNLYSFRVPAGRIPLPVDRPSRRRVRPVPSQGQVGDVLCESTLRPGTNIRGHSIGLDSARGASDWRARARESLLQAQKDRSMRAK